MEVINNKVAIVYNKQMADEQAQNEIKNVFDK